jgi:hypothetical protein
MNNPPEKARAASGLAKTATLMSKLKMVVTPPPTAAPTVKPSIGSPVADSQPPPRLSDLPFSGQVAAPSPLKKRRSPAPGLHPHAVPRTPRKTKRPRSSPPPPPQLTSDEKSLQTKMLARLPAAITKIEERLPIPKETENVERWRQKFILGKVFRSVRNQYLEKNKMSIHKLDEMGAREMVVMLDTLYELIYMSAIDINSRVNLNNIHKITKFYSAFEGHTTTLINHAQYMRKALNKAAGSNFVNRWFREDIKKRKAEKKRADWDNEQDRISSVEQGAAADDEDGGYTASSQQTQNQS